MESNRFKGKLALLVFSIAAHLVVVDSAFATMIFYYDPDTGNVSFDSSQTLSGGTFSYLLEIDSGATRIRFRNENLIRLSAGAAQVNNRDDHLFEGSLSIFLTGLYTIGNVLPSGLAEETWQKLFATGRYPYETLPVMGSLGHHSFIHKLGPAPRELAEFVYGLPNGEFINRLELVDPTDLIWAEAAKLLYSPSTGELQIDTPGHLTALRLESEGLFFPENFTPIVETPYVLSSPDQIVLLSGLVEPGQYALGKILPANLTATSLESVLKSASFIARPGFNGGDYDFHAHGIGFELEIIPEPTGLAITIFSSVTALTLHRGFVN